MEVLDFFFRYSSIISVIHQNPRRKNEGETTKPQEVQKGGARIRPQAEASRRERTSAEFEGTGLSDRLQSPDMGAIESRGIMIV